MYSDGDLDAAVAAGALSPEAAEAFRAHVARSRQSPAADEEHFRLLTGFNDIFVSIAIAMVLVALVSFGRFPAPGLVAGLVAVVSWAMAEFFTRRRRMALPSIFLLVAFACGVGGFAVSALAVFPISSTGLPRPGDPALSTYDDWKVVAVALAVTIATYAHWLRFKVPITVAAAVAALLATLATILFLVFPVLRPHAMLVLLAAGLTVFAVAMWWDASDRARRTRRSDVAFWLHLMAVPMLVHPAFAMLGMLHGGEISPVRAGAVIAIYLLLGLVALAIDRRALLVSALAYVLTAMSALFKAAGSAGLSFALTALVIGSLLLLLSAFWHSARRPVLAAMPSALRARLPVA